MLNFEKVSKVFYSPSGTTQKIVSEISKNFELKQENYDLNSFNEEKTFDKELVIIGVPVFNRRIPKIACERLSKIKGNNTKTVVVLNYGNIGYGDALLELCELLKKNNFHIVGVATTVSQHSQFRELGLERPDTLDMAKINEFSRKVIEKISSGDENEIFVGGHKPYEKYSTSEFGLDCDENLCVECLDCVYTCPEEAINEESPTLTNLEDCTRCTTCISICSEGARSFSGSQYLKEYEDALSNNFSRKEAEFFL